MPPTPFTWVILETGSCFVFFNPGQPGPQSSYLVFPSCWDDRRHYHPQPLVVMGSRKLFAWAGLKLWSSQSLPPK
jgi:hypothetical protein